MRIVVGVDFSPSSRQAALWTATQYGAEAEITLVHANDVVRPPAALIGGSPEHHIQGVETARRGAQVRLGEWRASLRGTRVGTRIRTGPAARVLTQAARQLRADLIVVGEASPRSGLARMLGSTNGALLRGSPVSVLISRLPPERAVTRILTAVDDSERAERVIAETARMAGSRHPDVTILHVASAALIGPASIAASPVERGTVLARITARAARRAELHVRQLREAGVWAEALTIEGDPASVILRTARELAADLVIVGLRRATRVERALFGVIAHEVARQSPCSVLVVPG